MPSSGAVYGKLIQCRAKRLNVDIPPTKTISPKNAQRLQAKIISLSHTEHSTCRGRVNRGDTRQPFDAADHRYIRMLLPALFFTICIQKERRIDPPCSDSERAVVLLSLVFSLL